MIELLAADEPPLSHPDSAPIHLDRYVELLASEAPIKQQQAGLNWCFPKQLEYVHHAQLVSSGTDEADALLDRLVEQGMPEELEALGFVDVREFWAPWCVALCGDDIASIAFSARLAPAGAETGVATAPSFRGRGFAAAATAGWAVLPALRGRSLFYGTHRANRSSHRVAERLGRRFLGASMAIS